MGRGVRIFVEVVNSGGIEKRGASLGAVNFVAFFQEEFGKIGAILPCYPGNQSAFHE